MKTVQNMTEIEREEQFARAENAALQDVIAQCSTQAGANQFLHEGGIDWYDLDRLLVAISAAWRSPDFVSSVKAAYRDLVNNHVVYMARKAVEDHD